MYAVSKKIFFYANPRPENMHDSLEPGTKMRNGTKWERCGCARRPPPQPNWKESKSQCHLWVKLGEGAEKYCVSYRVAFCRTTVLPVPLGLPANSSKVIWQRVFWPETVSVPPILFFPRPKFQSLSESYKQKIVCRSLYKKKNLYYESLNRVQYKLGRILQTLKLMFFLPEIKYSSTRERRKMHTRLQSVCTIIHAVVIFH